MRDPGLFLLGVGVTLLVAAGIGVLVLAWAARRREDAVVDALMLEAILDRALAEEPRGEVVRLPRPGEPRASRGE